MKLFIYSVLLRLASGSPLVDNSANNYPTTTTVDSYPITTSTNVSSPIYTQISASANTGLPNSKKNHRHKHQCENGKYSKASPANVVSYPIETDSAVSDQSGTESSGASSYVPPLGSNKLNVSLDYNTDNATDGATTNSATTTTVVSDQATSSPTPLPDFYSQIQASSFGDV